MGKGGFAPKCHMEYAARINKIGQPKTDDGRKTRIQTRNEKRILDAAQEVFAAYGFHGATIDKVAEKAEMSKPNLHYYFKRKPDLYIAVLRRTLETWLAPLSHLDPEGDPAAELSRYIREKVEMSRRSPVSSRVFANEILQGAPFLQDYLESDLRNLVERKTAVIRGWIDEGRLRPIDPYHLLFLIWAATQHYADFQPQIKAVMDTPRLTKDYFADVSESLCQIILHGILPDPAGH
ncbi:MULTISPECIES: TetR family transcriptional regulator C-terminal domain-containing protein [unclassified Iodidimonas]|uniref:TetR family transcriptional regulator C-terminal domain-containing protein n=1 Tax=unclassified Iodidimonas TaxID=2626145 RepID=UPI00248268BE|nr:MULTISPECIES: TetR family transcriptional regulator C-terminal domain-containing protein [unclassified Iodidimonas]